METCVHCSAPAVERYTFVLDGHRVLGQAWVCRVCLEALLAAERIAVSGETISDADASRPRH